MIPVYVAHDTFTTDKEFIGMVDFDVQFPPNVLIVELPSGEMVKYEQAN